LLKLLLIENERVDVMTEIEESESASEASPKKELSKIIHRYGLESVLQSFIELTQVPECSEKYVADLHSRLVVALKTFQKSYDNE
jgi:hypothetical protein